MLPGRWRNLTLRLLFCLLALWGVAHADPGPRTPDGRFVFFYTPDGWISKYDVWQSAVVAEVRAGSALNGIALSSDGLWLLAANRQPHSVALFDAALHLVQTFAATARAGGASSPVRAVYDVAARRSFVVVLQDLPELWEISYDPKAEPIYDGLVHDYRLGEAVAQPGYLGIRRTRLDAPLADAYCCGPNAAYILGLAAPAGGPYRLQVLNLDIRRKITEVALSGQPHLAAGITWDWHGTTVFASPNRTGPTIDVIDTRTWQVLRRVAMPSPVHPDTFAQTLKEALHKTAQ